MQRALFNDMEFRSNGMGEDCLHLNVWTPARSGKERRPVLVYDSNDGFRIMRLDAASRAEPETSRARYLFLDPLFVTLQPALGR